MADKKEKGLGEKAGNYFLSKLVFKIAITGILTFLAWYGAEKSITIAEFNTAYASIPFSVILLAMLFDYGLDTGKLYNRMLGRGKNPLSKLLFAITAVGIFFISFTWLVSGTITLNLATISPPNIVAASIVALLLLMPNTGTSEWLLWLWIAETLVTQGQNLSILPLLGV